MQKEEEFQCHEYNIFNLVLVTSAGDGNTAQIPACIIDKQYLTIIIIITTTTKTLALKYFYAHIKVRF
uniref:Uncharacterized protein n=1 Tax=Glossina palpalis gambiensis TaxID=67801 RepID=A0A1B0BFH7_9MUSC